MLNQVQHDRVQHDKIVEGDVVILNSFQDLGGVVLKTGMLNQVQHDKNGEMLNQC
ncbi:hypothetical protein JW824_12445 [bacterium]|nr:hypothetical protein [bacterium]